MPRTQEYLCYYIKKLEHLVSSNKSVNIIKGAQRLRSSRSFDQYASESDKHPLPHNLASLGMRSPPDNEQQEKVIILPDREGTGMAISQEINVVGIV
ncbi:MAG: hypothetical protein ACTS77_01380 [Arsenophonus sp. NC-TX2-MAG3]